MSATFLPATARAEPAPREFEYLFLCELKANGDKGDPTTVKFSLPLAVFTLIFHCEPRFFTLSFGVTSIGGNWLGNHKSVGCGVTIGKACHTLPHMESLFVAKPSTMALQCAGLATREGVFNPSSSRRSHAPRQQLALESPRLHLLLFLVLLACFRAVRHRISSLFHSIYLQIMGVWPKYIYSVYTSTSMITCTFQ